MNGKKSRMLRKQAGGNTGEYIPKYIKYGYPGMNQRKLTHSCSRKKYKDLKYLYKLVGI